MFGRALREKRDAEVWGIELIRSVASTARQNLDQVLCGDVLSQLAEVPKGSFDCVICNDVLEHLVDPYQVLTAIKELLTKDGVVVCSIPNIRYFRNLFDFVIRGQWRYEEAGIMDKTHLRFFTKNSIAETFKSLGYRIVRLQGINPTPSWRVATLNFITGGFLDDTRYRQFACVAQPIERRFS